MSSNALHRRAFCIVAVLLSLPFAATAEQATEHAVKAAVVHKITKFVSWPADAFQASDDAIRFCVAGSEPLLEELEKLQAYEVHGRAIQVRGVVEPDDVVGNCEVLYLSEEGVQDSSPWVRQLSDKPVLTFGESGAGADAANIITLSINRNKVKFDINVAANEKTGLSIGAQLLQLAALSNKRRR
jgi:hypothetical protein